MHDLRVCVFAYVRERKREREREREREKERERERERGERERERERNRACVMWRFVNARRGTMIKQSEVYMSGVCVRRGGDQYRRTHLAGVRS